MDVTCASDITSMTAQTLRPVETPTDGKKPKSAPFIDFASIGQCISTGSGKIAAALFRLEDVQPPAQVSLTISARPTATLAAAVTLLDSHHQPLRRYGFEKFSRRGTSYTLDVFINADDADVAYLLLSPDAAWVGKEDSGIHSGTNTYTSSGPVFFSYNVGYEEKVNRQLTDAGSLQLEVKPLPH
jgi:hypothetical protein